MTQLTCIVCPKGCLLTIDEENGCTVTGHTCPRGEEYGRVELTSPRRVVTSTVRVTGGRYPRCPVKTAGEVPKGVMGQVVKALEGITLTAPVKLGQVVLANVCGTGVDIVTTRNL